MWSKPASTEQEAGTERGKKNRPAIVACLLRSTSQSFMQGRAARGRAEIAGYLGDRRKSAGGNAALLGEQGHEARVRLVRRKTADGAARDAAAQLDGCDNFFHAGDRRARKGFAVELHGEAAILRIADLDGGSVLARATEEEFTEAIAFVGVVAGGASKNESAGAVAKQTSKFAGDPAGSECSAVDVGGDDGDGLSLSRSDQRLCEHQCVEQTEAGAADIQCAAVFTDE